MNANHPNRSMTKRRDALLASARLVKTREAAQDLAYAYATDLYSEGSAAWLTGAPAWLVAAHRAVMMTSERDLNSLSWATAAGNAAYGSFLRPDYMALAHKHYWTANHAPNGARVARNDTSYAMEPYGLELDPAADFTSALDASSVDNLAPLAAAIEAAARKIV